MSKHSLFQIHDNVWIILRMNDFFILNEIVARYFFQTLAGKKNIKRNTRARHRMVCHSTCHWYTAFLDSFFWGHKSQIMHDSTMV